MCFNISGTSGDKSICIAIVSTAGGIALLILFCSCITLILLCKIMRTLRGIVNKQFSHTTQDAIFANGAETAAAEPEATHAEPRSSKEESPESKPPPEVDSAAAVEALYSVVSKEHCEQKRKANLQNQQYDDVVLSSMEVEIDPQDHANESVESQLQNANPEDAGYSRLCHPGPRISQTKKHSSSDMLKQDAMKGSLSAANSNNGSYSEVHPPPPRPSSRVMAGNYTLIDEKQDVPPPLPGRLDTSEPLLVTYELNTSPESKEIVPEINVYDTVVDTAPSEEFFDQRFMSEYHNI